MIKLTVTRTGDIIGTRRVDAPIWDLSLLFRVAHCVSRATGGLTPSPGLHGALVDAIGALQLSDLGSVLA